MIPKLYAELKKYDQFTYYNEVKHRSGDVIFNQAISYDKVKLENGRIVLSDKQTGNICSFESDLGFEVVELKFNRCQMDVFYNNIKIFSFFLKKKDICHDTGVSV